LATTYYHQLGPAGRVMRKYNWFNHELKEEKLNYYASDARMPASLIGLTLADLGMSPIPLTQLCAVWSEPPYATIALGTGTMASSARPFQHCHSFEIDNKIRRLSLPRPGDPVAKDGRPFFTYLSDAMARGAYVQVLMGDARLRMAMPYGTYNEDKEKSG